MARLSKSELKRVNATREVKRNILSKAYSVEQKAMDFVSAEYLKSRGKSLATANLTLL